MAKEKTLQSHNDMLSWQYRALIEQLEHVALHGGDDSCPCNQVDLGKDGKHYPEYCMGKHLLVVSSLCRETALMDEGRRDLLENIGSEALEYHEKAKTIYCKGGTWPDLAQWSRDARKKIEPIYYSCNPAKAKVHDVEKIAAMMDSGITYKEHIPMPMVINQGNPNEGIIPPAYKDYQVELNLVRSPNWSIDKAPQMSTFEKVQELLGLLRKQDREWVLLILLDTRLRLVGLTEFAIGNADTAIVSVLEVARMALKTNATSIILVHNHPAGDPDPSAADRRLYNHLKDALAKLEIQVPEFIIVGHRADYSMQAGHTMPAPNSQRPAFEVIDSPSKQVPASEIFPERRAEPVRIPVGMGGQSRLFEKKARLSDPATVTIAGKCTSDDCKFKVKATEITQGTTDNVKKLDPLIKEIAKRAESKSKIQTIIQGKTIGNTDKTFAMGITTTTRYEFQFKIVEGTDLIPSNDPFTFEANPKYVKTFQPRMRDRAATQLQVKNIAANLSPDLLILDFLSIDKGTPIVGPDLLVECGNGRVMAIIRASKDNPDKYAAYKAKLKEMAPSFGLSAETVNKMKIPVLVRVRLTAVDRKAFAEECNARTTIQSSAIENAKTDAEKITSEMLGGLDVLENESIEAAIRAQRNKPFVVAFLNKLPANEQAGLVDAKGVLSQEGVRRIVMAIFVATFHGDTGVSLGEKFFEATDAEVKTVFTGLLRSLALLARAETLTQTGAREKEYAFGEDLAKVITVYSRIKSIQDYTVAKYLAQAALEQRELNPFQERVLKVLDSNARSGKKIGMILASYAQAVIDSPPPGQSGLFAGVKLSKAELFESAVKKALSALVEDIAKLFDVNLASPVMTKAQMARAMKYQGSLFPSPEEVKQHIESVCPTCSVPAVPKKYELFQFQKEGYAWLKGRSFALLADEMGLGKTPQGIHWGADNRPALVIVPAALIWNWHREITTMWRINDSAIVLDGKMNLPGKLPDWTILSYGMLDHYLPQLKSAGFQCIIIDEAHLVKNMDTQRTRNILELVAPKEPKPTDKPIPNRLAITGTPVLNRPIELFTLMVFLGVKQKPQYQDFMKTYTESKVIKGRTIFTGAKNMPQLHELLKTFMLRRKKADVLKQLPPKINTPLFVSISNAEEYRKAERNFLSWLRDTKGAEAVARAVNAEIIMRLNALRQLAAIGKVEPVADWLKPCSETGTKVIIFSTFIEPLLKLAALKKSSMVYTGSLKPEDRQDMVDKFQKNADACFFMGTVGAAGVGITLTSASRVAFLDLPWTPGAKIQAEDRAHRIGQTKSVEIVNCLAKGTIDERMLKILDDKEFIIAQAVDGKTQDQAKNGSIANDLLQSFIHAPNLSDTVQQYVPDQIEILEGAR